MPRAHGRRGFLLSLAALAAAPAARAGIVQPWGSPAPKVGLPATDLEGRPWARPPGKALLVNFWASWCPPCRAEMPALQDLGEIYADHLAIVAVNFKERPATVQRFVRDSRLTLPVVLDPDGTVAAAWGVRTFPTSVLLTPDGRARWRVQGEHEWNDAASGRLVESLWR